MYMRETQMPTVTAATRALHKRLALFLLLILTPLTANAQAIATNLEELRFKVKPGDIVYLTDDAGEERRVQVLDLSPSSLRILVEDRERLLNEDRVMRIRQRLHDPLANGALIGAGVGLAPLAGYCLLARNSSESCDSSVAPAVLVYGGIGAAAGIGIDALIKGRKVVYQAPGTASTRDVVISPLLAPRVRGVRVSMRF
jgi:hypothetical protein